MSLCSAAWLGLAFGSAAAHAEPEAPELTRFHGARLPAAGERPVTAIGLGGVGAARWVGDPAWSPLPYSGALLGAGATLETWHVDRLDRVRASVSAGDLSAPGGATLDARALTVETFAGRALLERGAWTGLLGGGASVDGALREGLEDSFDAWLLAELGAAARWTPPAGGGRWVLDATLRLPVAGAGLRPFPEVPFQQSADGARFNASFVSWHSHASVGLNARATRFLSNGNAVYAGLDWRGRWSWADPGLARVGGQLELGLLWAAGGWR